MNFAPPSPWPLAVPATSGMPLPMRVLAMMTFGRPLSCALALSRAAAMACEIVAVDGDRVPVLRQEIRLGVFALGDLGHGVERHVVGVVDEDEVVEAVVAGEGDGFLGHAFLQAAVAGKRERRGGRKSCARRCCSARRRILPESAIADGVADALAERAGGGFDARGFMELRMAGRDRVELAEVFHIIARKPRSRRGAASRRETSNRGRRRG